MNALYHFAQPLPTTSVIYRIVCTVTGKFYVGSALNLSHRRKNHFNALLRNDHCNAKLQNAFNKYGPDTFIFEVLEFVLIPELLTAREQYWFDKLKPFGKKGFNIAPFAGSPLGVKHTPEACANMGASRRGKPSHNLGKKASPEAREKNRLAQLGNTRALGMRHTPETRAQMSVSRKGKPSHNLGKKASPETIEKLRLAGIGRVHSAETRTKMSIKGSAAKASSRKTLIVTSPDGVEYSIVGIHQFCREHNLDRSTLLKVAKGKYSHHKGWKARFPD
jgi:group I intron endonuclease